MKKAIRSACKTLGLSQDETNAIANTVTKYESDDDEEDISTYEQKIWILDHIRNKNNAEVIDIAKKFVGFVYGFSKHASALIVLNEDINRFCSVERQVDSKTKEISYVAACNFKYLEELQIMKLDMLGIKTLDVIQDTIEMSGADLSDIQLDDKSTSDMLTKGYTTGCFQIASPGMTQLVKQIKPKEFADLIPLVALYRPGPLGAVVEETGDTMVETYVKVRSGIIEPKYLHPKLEPILKDTYSIILYQEQILEIAKELCGYSLGEADVLRRIIGKKKVDEMKPALDNLIARGVANGIDEETMKKISDRIVTFALYGFNKGHSAGYGFTSYKTAYLKANFPLQYMCACLNNELKENRDKELALMYEAKRMGISILPPDLKHALWTIEEPNSLRVGYAYIKNVSDDLGILPETQSELFDYLNKRQAESLIKAGCFGENYNQLLSDLEYDKTIGKKMNDILAKLDTELSDKKRAEWECKLNSLPDRQMDIETTDDDRIKYQIEVLGFSFYEKEVGQRYQTDSLIPQIVSGELIEFKPRKDKKNKPMAFLKIRTPFGIVDNLVMFHRNYCELSEGQQYQMVVKKNIVEDVR